MSLLDKATEASRGNGTGPRCEICLWLQDQDPDVRTDVNEAMDAPLYMVKHTALLDAMNDEYGTEFSINQLSHHRRRKCRGRRESR